MEIYRNILESLTSGIISISRDGRILYINPIARKILHLYEKIENIHYKEAFQRYPEIIDLIYDMITNNKTIRRGEVRTSHVDVDIVIGYSTMQIKDEKNNHIGYTIIFQDLNIVYGKNI